VTSDALLLVDEGRVASFDGSIDDYPAWLAARQSEVDADRRQPGAVLAPAAGREAPARKDQRRLEAEQRRRTQPLRARLQALDKRLAALTERRTELEQALAATDLYEASAKARLIETLEDKRRVDEELDLVEGDWLDTSEALERLQEEGA